MPRHPDENANETEELEGYDPSQRAEILETEGRNPKDGAIVDDLTPDRGQSITEGEAVEEELHPVGTMPDQDIVDMMDEDSSENNEWQRIWKSCAGRKARRAGRANKARYPEQAARPGRRGRYAVDHDPGCLSGR